MRALSFAAAQESLRTGVAMMMAQQSSPQDWRKWLRTTRIAAGLTP